MDFHFENASLEVVGLSHVGKVRDNNEDSFAASIQDNVFLVSDGMGGHAAGEVASAITAAQVILAKRAGSDLEQATWLAHNTIMSDAQQHKERQTMGATLVAMSINKLEVNMVWVGDSRIYLATTAGAMPKQLTRDQTMAQAMVDAGEITKRQARTSPYRSVLTAALGSDSLSPIQINQRKVDISPGATLLLCSDGLTDMLQDNQIMQLLHFSPTLYGTAQNLVAAALAAGGRDNVTVLLVHIKEIT